jgi:Bacterial protein of unknown function (DUF885)
VRGMASGAIAVLLLGACGGGTSADAGPAWDRFAAGFIESYFRADPLFAAYQGRHEYDGQFPDWSEAGLKARAAELHAQRDSALGFTLAGDTARAFERDYVVSRIDRDLFWLERSDWPHRNPEYYAGSMDPNVYIAREYAPLPERMKSFTKYAANLPAALASIRTNLRTPMPSAYARIGNGRFAGLADYLEKDVPAVFAEVRDSTLNREFAAANASAVKALRELAAWFTQEEAQGTDQFAIGPELFADMLRMTEGVQVPLADLEAKGRADMDRNLAALREACAAFAKGRPIPDCVARANARKPPGGSVEAARHQLDTLETFVRNRDIVSIPGTERALVHESPPYQRFNFAYIDIPGPYEKNLPSIYYIAPPDPQWSRAEQQAYIPSEGTLLFVSVHEVWPGHFLHFLHANRVKSQIGRVFVGYAYGEGWGHYAEEMMWEAGLGSGDPRLHIGQLMNALLRNARYLSAIGLHTRGMTLAESERLFREEAFQDPGNARQQALRGTYDPAYLNYTMGKLMIRKLREDWTASRGGQKAWKAFHDRFLSFGGPPIPMVRRRMLGAGGDVM